MSKRLFDVVVALVGLAVLSPLFLLVFLAVKAGSPGPALFRQTRVGRGGRHFQILKFRTMHHAMNTGGLQVTAGNDPRITKEGRWLRRWKLDELPQLINVLAGDMSLVGPRPEVPRYADLWPAHLRGLILSVRPGLTDPATLEFLDEEEMLAGATEPEAFYVGSILPAKAAAYADYARNYNLRSDLFTLWKTVTKLGWHRPSETARLLSL